MAGHPIGQLFSKLHEAFASPGGATHRLVIDRRTIEKTWKYMDKVIKCLERYHGIFKTYYKLSYGNFLSNEKSFTF